MVKNRDIAVVGGGIGGLTAAALLSAQGNDVTLFDQFDAPQPIGSGLVIQPIGQAVLEQLGLLHAALDHGVPIHKMEGHSHPGNRMVLEAHYGPEGSDRFGLAIHRGALFSLLLNLARSAGVRLESDARVLSVSAGSKPYLRIEGGVQAGPYDLVVDAAGAGSPLSPLQAKPLPFGALWATVPLPAGESDLGGVLRQRYQDAIRMAGVLPVGTTPGDPRPKAALFWSLQTNQYQRWRETDFASFKEHATAMWPDFGTLLAPLRSHDDMTFATYAHGSLIRKRSPRVAHIGDAAHQASPQLGQGANMALLDAMVLAESLERHGIARALRDYSANRYAHVAFYQTVSRLLTPLYQSRYRTVSGLRDRVFGPIARSWFLRPAITALVSGTAVPASFRRRGTTSRLRRPRAVRSERQAGE